MSDEDKRGIGLRGLDLFHAMYIVGLAFGLQEISRALYTNLRSVAGSGASMGTAAANTLLFISIILLIVRFFWSTGNIRRAMNRDGPALSEKTKRIVVMIHLPILLLQGTLVLFVCLAYAEWIETRTGAFNVIGWFLVATALNTAWLWSLTRGRKAGEARGPEFLWMQNNLIFVFSVLILMSVVKFEDIPEASLLIVFAAMSLVSSGYDLYRTAAVYIADLGR